MNRVVCAILSWPFTVLSAVFVAASAALTSRRQGPLLRAHPAVAKGSMALASIVLVLAGLEVTAASLIRAGLVRRYTPTETRQAEQTEDWRMVHIMSDEYREPDPVLLWRPVPRAPYTAQRFRGPEVALRKPPNTVRIICYGSILRRQPHCPRSDCRRGSRPAPPRHAGTEGRRDRLFGRSRS